MIFIDANVPMYLVGGPHANKERARDLLGELIRGQDRLITSSEVFQEILHRYTALRRPQTIPHAWQLLADATDEIFPVEYADVANARQLIAAAGWISARDALHVAIMKRHGVRRVFSFDTGFDKVEEIVRLA